MGCRLFCLLLFVRMISGALSASDSGGRPDTSKDVPESTLYAYLNQAGGWCALRSRTTFMAEVRSDKASQLEADQAQIWLKGTIVDKITEFRMDADGEWSTTSTYRVDESGNVVSVNVVARSGEPATNKTFNFTVAKGVYSPNTPSSLSPETFRKAVSASSFPYWDLVEKLASNKAAEKLCT
jgi:hypothetical protein